MLKHRHVVDQKPRSYGRMDIFNGINVSTYEGKKGICTQNQYKEVMNLLNHNVDHVNMIRL